MLSQMKSFTHHRTIKDKRQYAGMQRSDWGVWTVCHAGQFRPSLAQGQGSTTHTLWWCWDQPVIAQQVVLRMKKKEFYKYSQLYIGRLLCCLTVMGCFCSFIFQRNLMSWWALLMIHLRWLEQSVREMLPHKKVYYTIYSVTPKVGRDRSLCSIMGPILTKEPS